MLDQLKDRAADHFGDLKQGQAFDPTIILIIAEMIVELIEALRTYCAPDDPTAALDIVKSPSWLSLFWAQRKLRRKLGFKEYRQHGDDLLEALKRTGKEMTIEDMKQAYAEIF